MQIKSVLFIIAFLFSIAFLAQVSNQEIEIIRADIKKSKFFDAERKLSLAYKKDKTNVEINWLYAYTLSQLGKYNESKEMYENTLKLFPDSNALKFEFAQTLLKMGNLNDAEKIIADLKDTNLDQTAVLLADAEIKYWKAHYAQALESLNRIDAKYPKNVLTNDLKLKIKEAQSTYVSITGDLANDNQPLNAISESFTIGKMQSYWLHPTLEIKNTNFTDNAQSTSFILGNQVQFANNGFGTQLKVGLNYNHVTENKNLIGSLLLNQSLSKKSKLSIGVEHLVYNSTLESTKTDLLYTKGKIEFKSGDYTHSFLHIGYDYNFFEDNNVIQNFGAWYISKPLTESSLKVQLGYGFGYSDAKKTTYTPTQTTTVGIGTFVLPGKYVLYFTPNNQIVNSAVVVINYPFTKKLNASAKANYGFYATTHSPRYTKTSSMFNSEIKYSEVKTTFNPVDAGFSLQYHISNRLSLTTQVSYFKSYFYDSTNGNIRLDYKF